MRHTTEAGSKRFDCFYLYPTASQEKSVNSNLKVQAAERQIASDQVSRFSQVCNVWAPMYRQVTVAGLGKAGSEGNRPGTIAYASVLAAWTSFLAHDDHGRPVIFISHSQGSVELIRLLQSEVDPKPALVKRTALAIIAGGNVTVPDGKLEGATFHSLPLCTAKKRAGCVIAYSSFPKQPPANAQYGRPGQGISLNEGQTATAGVHVACVNPAAVGRTSTAPLTPYFKTTAPPPLSQMRPPLPATTTPWVTYPKRFTGKCESRDGTTWLEVRDHATKAELLPRLGELFGPTWGYHFDDINIPLGNLVSDVRTAEARYRR